LLCAGFPCQSFSISGKQKGILDEVRGTLFFDICRILEIKKPKAFILENVQNLEKHDNGKTLSVMLDMLHKLGYSVSYEILNAKDFDSPQNRERVIIVGNTKGIYFDFEKIKKFKSKPMKEYLKNNSNFEVLNEDEYTLIDEKYIKEQKKSGLIFVGYRNKKIRTTGVRQGTEHLSRVHKQPNRIYSSDGTHPTIASQETSGRYFILNDGVVRKLTLDECFLFMGFPKEFKKIGLKSKLYERIGNSVCISMIKSVGEEMKNQIFNENTKEYEVTQFLENIYNLAISKLELYETELTETQRLWLKIIVEKEESFKGVFTVLITSLVYKCLYPNQDVRYHKKELQNGYSGRSFDTKYITPFLKVKRFLGAMKESGWLTRSLEQVHPFTFDFPGKINDKNVKEAFLSILNDVEENKVNPKIYLLELMVLSIREKSKKIVNITNPINRESKLNIDDIINLLKKHFYYKYSSRGASILPVIAFYSLYECLISELNRFKDKKLEILESHNSSDRSSGKTGDISIVDIVSGEVFEAIEIKFDIKPNKIMILDAYNKIKNTKLQRYYILSTVTTDDIEIEEINKIISEVKREHGCQIIVNGIFETIAYYLRLLENTDLFINNYVENLQKNEELSYEHKLSWNIINQ